MLVVALFAMPGAPAQVDGYLAGLDALERGAFEEAVATLMSVVEADGESADAHVALGVACLFHEKLALARKHLELADRLRGNHKPTRLWLASAVAMDGGLFEDTKIYAAATRDPFETAVREMSRRYGDPTFRRIRLNEVDPRAAATQAAERARFPALARMFVERTKPAGAKLGGALRARGLAAFAAGRCSEAYADLRHVLRSQPDDLDVRFAVAGCELALGVLEGARADYTRCLTARHDWREARAGLARAQAALSEPKPAPVTLEKALSGERSVDELIRFTQSRRLRADETYEAGLRAARERGERTELGAFLYENATTVLTEWVEPRAQPAPCRPQRPDAELAEAIAVLDQALAANGKDVKALVFRAACHIERFEWAAARAKIERALDLDPREPAVLGVLARVLDQSARVQAAAAADLRAVKTWSDYWYIYYRYPSQAELQQAAALEAQARWLQERARSSLVQAAAAAKGTADGDYHAARLAAWDGDREAARAALESAVARDPRHRAAWTMLIEICGRLGDTDAAYHAQHAAANLSHTTAAPMLKLAWLHVQRTAFDTAAQALAKAAATDPADPRVAAYIGVIVEAKGDVTNAHRWYALARSLDAAVQRFAGVFFDDAAQDLAAGDAARQMQLALRTARTALATGGAELAESTCAAALALYERVPEAERYAPVPGAMLPDVPDDPGRLAEAPNVETIACWLRLRHGNACEALGRHADAERDYGWVTAFEARKPSTAQLGEAIREPGKLATVYLARCLLRQGKRDIANRALMMLGHPRGMSKDGVRELEEVRREVEEALGAGAHRPQTLTEMRRQALLEQRRVLLERRAADERVLADPGAADADKRRAKIALADSAEELRRLDEEIARVNRGR